MGLLAGGLEFSQVQAHSSQWNITEAAVRYFSQVKRKLSGTGELSSLKIFQGVD